MDCDLQALKKDGKAGQFGKQGGYRHCFASERIIRQCRYLLPIMSVSLISQLHHIGFHNCIGAIMALYYSKMHKSFHSCLSQTDLKVAYRLSWRHITNWLSKPLEAMVLFPENRDQDHALRPHTRPAFKATHQHILDRVSKPCIKRKRIRRVRLFLRQQLAQTLMHFFKFSCAYMDALPEACGEGIGKIPAGIPVV